MTAPKTASSTEKNERLRKAGAEYAEKQIAKTFEKSRIVDNACNYPKFSKEELTLGKVLGKGGFGTVYEVRGFEAGKSFDKTKLTRSLEDGNDCGVEQGEMESRKFIAEHCIRKGGDARYAAKFLSQEVIDNPPTFIRGIMDIATETRVLSDIEHPNIIKMRACGEVSPFDAKYCIVMDRLYDTLDGRIEKWGNRMKRNSGFGGKLFDRKGLKKKSILEEKLVGAFDLSAALGHLHAKKIVYRDLKPENIGFDCVSHDEIETTLLCGPSR
jgi:serine/threonine protein kinase